MDRGYAKLDRRPGRRRYWLLLLAAFAGLHYLSLWIATFTGNFDPNPNHDHVRVMRQVLADGVPRLAIWPPGFGYYLAFKQRLTEMLGLPYWTAKLFVDVVPLVLSGVLSVLLALRLTGDRRIAALSGLAMVGAPIFALASAEDLAVLLFQPLFLGAMLALVAALQAVTGRGDRGAGPRRRWGLFAAAGALMGLACLVRANPQFLLIALAPAVWAWLRRRGAAHPARTAAAGLLLALAAQTVVLLPWSLLQRSLGQSGAVAAPVVYYAFFDGIRRHDGFEVSEALRADPAPPPLSFDGVVELHREWLARDPAALAHLYGAKLVRTWYLSDSGRWDRAIALVHAPLWILAIVGLGLGLRRDRTRPALWLVMTTVLYFWAVSAAVSGLARYMAPVYGLLGLLAGVAVVTWIDRMKRRGSAPPGRDALDLDPGS